MVCYIWEYNVLEDQVDAFKKAYKTNGDWCQLFIKSDAYIQSEFYSDKNNPCRFVTIDIWKSSEDFAAFKKAHKKDYEALDFRCEDLCDIEVFVGEFEMNKEKGDSMNFYDIFN